MKTLTFLASVLVFLAFVPDMHAQSPWQKTNSNIFRPADPGTSRSLGGVPVSPAGAWIGSSLLYEFGDSLGENWIVNGSVLLPIGSFGEWQFALSSNVDISLNALEHVELGIYPYKKSGLFVFHGGGEFVSDGRLEETMIRAYMGAELAILNDIGLPITASLAPVAEFDKEVVFGLDAAFVIPLANGLGLLGQIQSRFDGRKTLFGLGVLTSKVL